MYLPFSLAGADWISLAIVLVSLAMIIALIEIRTRRVARSNEHYNEELLMMRKEIYDRCEKYAFNA